MASVPRSRDAASTSACATGRTIHFKRMGKLGAAVYSRKFHLDFEAGLRQCCTDIIRFSHGASSSKKVYRSSFIPGLHDVCVIFEKTK